MVEYRSRLKELSFYVNGKRKKFSEGVYKTNNKAEMKVLDTLADVKKVKAEDQSKQKEIEAKQGPSKKSSAK